MDVFFIFHPQDIPEMIWCYLVDTLCLLTVQFAFQQLVVYKMNTKSKYVYRAIYIEYRVKYNYD